MSISHGIVAAHGGSLELCPSVADEQGACFRLTLPAHAEAPKSSVAIAHAGSRGSGLHALIVDDEATIRKLLARLLARRGFEVLEAESGESALAVAASHALSVVLCDVQMPGMHGGELYRKLTLVDSNLARNFIFITGDKSAVVVDEALRHVPVLEKPFTAADLHATLERIGIDAAVA